VRLARSYFYEIDGGQIRLHDFGTSRFLRLAGNDRLEDYPLLATVAEREMELAREMDQLTVMTRSGITPADADSTIFYAESRAGMVSSIGAFPARQVSSGSEEIAWTVAGEFAAGWVPGGLDLPVEFRDIYSLFLTHTLPLHPELKRALVQQAKLPRRLRYRERLASQWRETTLHFSGFSPARDSLLPDLESSHALASSANPLARAVAEATGLLDGGRRPNSAEEFRLQFNELMDRELALEATLVVLEIYLQTGSDTEQAMTRVEPYADLDPQLRLVLDGMDTSTPDTATTSLKNLAKVDRSKLLRKHVYDALAGNALLGMGRYREAEKAYLDALERNPWLTGVYKKLGDLYSASERMPQAWVCYETALKLQDRHPMLKSIIEEAPKLRQRHPEFFLPEKNR
jgi:tetratricopeptide (TPR) repeat protein